MNERKWTPQIGDHVYHICEYNVMDIELKIKGLEGFRTYGIEVVESVVLRPYRWKSYGVGCETACFEDVYSRWRDGELTTVQAALEVEMPQSSFSVAAARELKKRGETHTYRTRGRNRKLPEDFNNVYEEWENGEIGITEAGRKLGMDYKSFKHHAEKMYKKRQEAGIICTD